MSALRVAATLRTINMSDQWIFYPCQMGGQRASIFYDHGIRESINNIAPPHLLNIRVAFKAPRSDGMPANEEFEALNAFEDDLRMVAQQHESIFVGRVTVDGNRHFYIYTPDAEEDWSERVDMLRARHKYAVAWAHKRDERRNGYWKELYPTEDDWQVIQDLGVIEALRKGGDNGRASRQIDHWAFFPSRALAEEYSDWLRERGYTLDGIEDDDDRISVRFKHYGTTRLEDISSHTISLQRKARELGGNYDGWETPVCKETT